jgi:hypothetical protein
MKFKKIINYILFSFVLFSFVSCSSSGRVVSQLKDTEQSKQTGSAPLVIWEPTPRPIAKGNDGQLLIRTSESIKLLYAAHNNKGKQNLFMSGSKNIGDSFSKAKRVNSVEDEVSAHGENGPKLRQGKGRGMFAAWIGNRDIKFARSMNFGRSFNSSIRVNDDIGKASQSFFNMEVAPDGKVFITWLDGRDKKSNLPGSSSIYIARSVDQGKSFGKNIKISGNICPCCRPALAFGDNGEVFVSWRHVFKDHERIIVVASSLDGGKTWGNPVKVSNTGWKINGCAHSGPAMKYVEGQLFVTWYTGKNDNANLKFAYSLDKGKTFLKEKNIQGSVLDANHPNMAILGNEVWVIFQGRDSMLGGGWSREKAWLVKISSDGNTSKPSALPTTEGGVFYPKLYKGNGGRVYAVWTGLGEDGSKVMLCRGRLSS